MTPLLSVRDLSASFALDGQELPAVRGVSFDVERGETVALVGVGDELGRQIDFFKVNPTARRLEPAGSITAANGLIPYGSCMYHSEVSGKYYYFVNAQSGATQQWELWDGGNGNVAGAVVREFDLDSQTEGCVADDILGHFYIGEEKVGLWKYGAEPGDGATRTQVDKTGNGGNLVADVEGLSIYYAGADAGYLLASSQGDSTVAVYTREGSNSFLGRFHVGSSGDIDEVTNSDGLDVTNFPLGPGFGTGLFAIHDTSNDGAPASNVKFVPWATIASPLGLAVDTAWDPRKVGEGAVKLNDVTVDDPHLMIAVGPEPLKLSLGKKKHGLLTN